MRVTIDTSEVHQMVVGVNRRLGQFPRRAETVVSKVGHDMQAAAMANTPVDTGFLKSSYDLSIIGLGFDLGPTAEYGGYVELGTSRMGPEPYLGPAFDAVLPNLESALGAIGEDVWGRA